ncbi:MAG: flagellar assembly protein FliW [Candidatus Eisenbacteria sp.]|nr:flagellar assembly protein FliW [Candidatus Eisenbacteria bacterium]
MIEIETHEWGTLKVKEDTIIHFQDGLLGFEELCDFVFVDVAEFRPFVWFSSVEDPQVRFAVADPFYFSTKAYDVSLSAADEAGLELEEGDSIAIFVIVSIDNGQVTGNLKGPIVLNTRNRRAKQLVVYGTSFPVRQPMLNRRVVPLHSAVANAAVKTTPAA